MSDWFKQQQQKIQRQQQQDRQDYLSGLTGNRSTSTNIFSGAYNKGVGERSVTEFYREKNKSISRKLWGTR
jgi:hypothetical protein